MKQRKQSEFAAFYDETKGDKIDLSKILEGVGSAIFHGRKEEILEGKPWENEHLFSSAILDHSDVDELGRKRAYFAHVTLTLSSNPMYDQPPTPECDSPEYERNPAEGDGAAAFYGTDLRCKKCRRLHTK